MDHTFLVSYLVITIKNQFGINECTIWFGFYIVVAKTNNRFHNFRPTSDNGFLVLPRSVIKSRDPADTVISAWRESGPSHAHSTRYSQLISRTFEFPPRLFPLELWADELIRQFTNLLLEYPDYNTALFGAFRQDSLVIRQIRIFSGKGEWKHVNCGKNSFQYHLMSAASFILSLGLVILLVSLSDWPTIVPGTRWAGL